MEYLIEYALIFGGLIVTICAQAYISSNYRKYIKAMVQRGMSGFDTAREILDKNGLSHILILETQGELTDHYDPNKKIVKLSTEIYHEKSIASVAVAAHECGHALQDKEGYPFLKFRHTLIPFVNISSKVGYIAVLLGLIMGLLDLLYVGIALELIILLFQLVTLPVEFNASKRALEQLEKLGIVNNNEHDGAKKMLTSAALTYVASVLSSLMQILRLVLIASRGRRR